MRAEPHERFRGIYWVLDQGSRTLATRNMDRGHRVYGERLFSIDGEEYREWVPYRSKLAAAILSGLKELPIGEGSRILYLGAATGTTVSHISDIVGPSGVIYAVDFAPRVMVQFLENVARRRVNVVPIFEDARMPELYTHLVGKVDVVYCDVAQPEQAKLLLDNCRLYLKRRGEAFLAVKARSIDSAEDPERIYRREITILEGGGLRIAEKINLEPYEKDHIMVRAVYERP